MFICRVGSPAICVSLVAVTVRCWKGPACNVGGAHCAGTAPYRKQQQITFRYIPMQRQQVQPRQRRCPAGRLLLLCRRLCILLLFLLLLVSVNHDWQASRQCRLYPAKSRPRAGSSRSWQARRGHTTARNAAGCTAALAFQLLEGGHPSTVACLRRQKQTK